MTKQTYKADIIGGTHGVTCAFPKLKDIIDYEEGSRVPNQGYPRFVKHPYVVAIEDKYRIDGYQSFAVQSLEAAHYLHKKYFESIVHENSFVKGFDISSNEFGVIYVTNEFAKTVKDDITNTGIVLNSRKAHRILKNIKPATQELKLKHILSSLEKGSNSEQTFLYTSGMAAIYSALSSFLFENSRAVVIGNTYVDTRKLFENIPKRIKCQPTFFQNGENRIPIPDSTSVVFLEIPINPLLKVNDIKQIVEEAHDRGAIVIVDSTIATPHHFSPFDYGVDIIIHSTSKSLSGKNNHLGGALFINPACTELFNELIFSPFELDIEEAIILEQNISDFDHRIRKMSENAERIVSYLNNHSAVSKVYYPSGLKNGNGHIISFELNNESYETAEAFYNNCKIPIKGPSMGYERTMLMPYPLITHYHDGDEYLSNMGLKRYLMRLSVGTENPDKIIRGLSVGFQSMAVYI